MISAYNQISARGLERIAGLSDGVFAIAMTLIVFEIRVPDTASIHSEAELWSALRTLGPQLVTYLLSFLTLGIFWSGQQTQLSHLARGDRHLTWIYIGFLACVAIMPFSTLILGQFIQLRLALLLYWMNFALLGAILYGAWSYSIRSGLLKPDAPAEVQALVKRRIIVAQALYALGAALVVFGTGVSIAFIVLVQQNFAIAPRIPGLSRI